MASSCDISEVEGRLVVARSKASAGSELFARAAGLAFGMAALAGWLWVVGDLAALFQPGSLIVLLLIMTGIVSGGVGLPRARRGYRNQELLVLDRAADSVMRAGQKACALSEVEHVVLRRYDRNTSDGSFVVFEVGLAMAGLGGRGAPRHGGTFDEVIEVCHSTDEEDMGHCARRLAGYAGVPNNTNQPST